MDRIELMGSRRWGLSSPESDIDAALVAVSDPGPIADAVAEFYGKRAERVKRLATKAGLHLVIVDPFLDSGLPRGRIKLEYTVQTPEQNRLIKMTGEEGAARMSPEERATYANSMRQCFLSGDEEGKSNLKGWLKALPEPQPQ